MRQASACRSVSLLVDDPLRAARTPAAGAMMSHRPPLPVVRRIARPPLQPLLPTQRLQVVMVARWAQVRGELDTARALGSLLLLLLTPRIADLHRHAINLGRDTLPCQYAASLCRRQPGMRRMQPGASSHAVSMTGEALPICNSRIPLTPGPGALFQGFFGVY